MKAEDFVEFYSRLSFKERELAGQAWDGEGLGQDVLDDLAGVFQVFS